MQKNIFLVGISDDKTETFGGVEKFQLPREPFGVILDDESRFVVLGLLDLSDFLIVRNAGRTGDCQLETGLSLLVLTVFQVDFDAFKVLVK